jgi:Recombination directionality factor-like
MTTRVSVVVPDLIGVGTWMLESHGFYAATELPGVAEMLAAYAERGVMVPAELRIEQRQRRIYRGEGAAPEQRSYPVPVLDVLATVREIQQAAVEGRKFAGALPAPLVPRKALAAGPAPRAIEDRVRADAESESAAQSLAGDALAARDVDALRGVWDMAVQAGVVDEFVTVPHYQELISLSDVIAEHKKAILAGAVA